MKQVLFKGSAAALVTPMQDDLSVNYDMLDTLIERQIANGTDALVITGTTGEASTLTNEEHLQVIARAVEKTAHRIPVIAGTGSNNTAHAVFLSKEAERLGADGVLLVTPYYNKASQEGIYRHFKACADAIHLPIVLYNVPTRTSVNILPQTYQRLSEIDNIVATKEASGNFSQMAKIISLCGDNLAVYSGNDDQITSALALGAKGVISVLANIVPQETHDICQSYFDGNSSLSDTLQLRYLELIEALFSDVNPIPVKQALEWMGFPVGSCRLPLCDMNDVLKEKLMVCLTKYGLVEPESKIGSVTVRRPPCSLLWRVNH